MAGPASAGPVVSAVEVASAGSVVNSLDAATATGAVCRQDVCAASRREFLVRAGRGTVGVVCLVATPWMSGCASFPRVFPIREGAMARIPVAAFQTSRGVLFDYPKEGMPVYVHKHSAERFTAVLTRCAHRGCEVEPNADRMICPCHGSEYRYDGGLLEGPAESPLVSYPVVVVGDFVRIDLSGGGRG